MTVVTLLVGLTFYFQIHFIPLFIACSSFALDKDEYYTSLNSTYPVDFLLHVLHPRFWVFSVLLIASCFLIREQVSHQ